MDLTFACRGRSGDDGVVVVGGPGVAPAGGQRVVNMASDEAALRWLVVHGATVAGEVGMLAAGAGQHGGLLGGGEVDQPNRMSPKVASCSRASASSAS